MTPSLKLYLYGATLLTALLFCWREFGNLGAPRFLLPLGLAGLVYLLAVRELLKTQALPRRVVIVGMVLAALWHVPFLMSHPGIDDDIHRYLWDGRIQRLGYNPYVAIPNDPALVGLHTAETRTLNNSYLPSPYPPGAELFFRAVTSIHESIFALKIAFVLCDVAIVMILFNLLHRTGEGEHWVLTYAWNPLLAIEVAGSGHIDILGALLLLISFAALSRRWRAVASVSFGLAVAVKFLPIVLVPFYWKRIRFRDAAVAAVVVALLYVPFLQHGGTPLGSLGTYVQSFRFNAPVFAVLERWASPQAIAVLAVCVGLAVAAWIRRKDESIFSHDLAWPMTATLLCAPVVYPWYLLWLLPFVRTSSTVPIMVWTVSIIPTYYVWHLRALGHPWILPGWIMLLEFGAVTLAAVIEFGWKQPRPQP